jgi:hypothetical protein
LGFLLREWLMKNFFFLCNCVFLNDRWVLSSFFLNDRRVHNSLFFNDRRVLNGRFFDDWWVLSSLFNRRRMHSSLLSHRRMLSSLFFDKRVLNGRFFDDWWVLSSLFFNDRRVLNGLFFNDRRVLNGLFFNDRCVFSSLFLSDRRMHNSLLGDGISSWVRKTIRTSGHEAWWGMDAVYRRVWWLLISIKISYNQSILKLTGCALPLAFASPFSLCPSFALASGWAGGGSFLDSVSTWLVFHS